MKKYLLLALLAFICQGTFAFNKTFPLKGAFISPADQHILYAGRISFTHPERPAWNYPGVQIVAAFEGTSLKMLAKPRSGYFMAQIDQAEPFKVAFRGERDSVVTLATALPDSRHTVRLMYIIEGYEFFPEFWGFLLDEGRSLVEAPALPSRKIEFIGNSITCGYGNEGTDKFEHFEYETENHYYSYASIAARRKCVFRTAFMPKKPHARRHAKSTSPSTMAALFKCIYLTTIPMTPAITMTVTPTMLPSEKDPMVASSRMMGPK